MYDYTKNAVICDNCNDVIGEGKPEQVSIDFRYRFEGNLQDFCTIDCLMAKTEEDLT